MSNKLFTQYFTCIIVVDDKCWQWQIIIYKHTLLDNHFNVKTMNSTHLSLRSRFKSRRLLLLSCRRCVVLSYALAFLKCKLLNINLKKNFFFERKIQNDGQLMCWSILIHLHVGHKWDIAGSPVSCHYSLLSSVSLLFLFPVLFFFKSLCSWANSSLLFCM